MDKAGQEQKLSEITKSDELSTENYTITVEASGVYVTINPSQASGVSIDPHVLYANLLAKDLHTVKQELVARAVTTPTGKPVLIGEYPGPVEPEIKIELAKNKMEASLEVAPSRKGRLPSIGDIKERLAAAGVIHGIDDDAIIIAMDQPKKPHVIAHGTPPVDGTSARIELAFDFTKMGKPKEQADGSVSFHDLGFIFNVRTEDVLAEKIPRTEGEPGTTVLGDALPAKPGKDIPLPLGKNVYADEDGKVRAAIDGQVQYVAGKLHVAPVFEVREDVDIATGNIDFVGSVIVRGSVQVGFSVKAEGDIEVYGTVSGATLEAQNIVVRSGIQGMQRGIIRAKGNITAKFIENANVIAQDTVSVAEAILHSNVSAGKRVIVQGKKGVIVGGSVRAGEEVHTRFVGSHLATPTSLEVGVNPELRDELSKARKEMREVQFHLDQTQKAVQLLKNLEANGMITPEKKEMLLKVTKSYYHLTGQLETLRNRICDVELQIDELRYGKIKVAEMIHPGVKIVVGSAILPVRDSIRFATLYEEDGDVKVGPYK